MAQQLPDYVKPYKTKGVYAQKRKNGYSLFRGHSERVPGAKYPRLICDEYLGIVTEKDGFIPSRPSVKKGIRVVEYGRYQTAISLTSYITGDRRIYVLALMGALSREGWRDGYEYTWPSVLYADADVETAPDEKENEEIGRKTKQIRTILQDRLGEDYGKVMKLSSYVHAVHVNGGWHLSDLPEGLDELLMKHEVVFETMGG